LKVAWKGIRLSSVTTQSLFSHRGLIASVRAMLAAQAVQAVQAVQLLSCLNYYRY